MKKLVIILAAIALTGAAGFAQKSTSIITLNGDTITLNSEQLKKLKSVLDDTMNYSAEINTLKIQINNPQPPKQNYFSWDKILLYALAVVAAGLLIYIPIDRKGRRDKIINTLTKGHSDRLHKWKEGIITTAIEAAKQNQSATSATKTYDNETARLIKDLQNRIATLEDGNKPTNNG
ncbi:MAG: hypothetical protein LBR34_09575, partial [Prevotella sp.]|nr:hypothetical protein [Prevotella sp.]